MSANQRPRLHVAPPAESTFGDLAGDFSADYGLIPDPWQRLVLDDWLARAGGQWASLSCGLSCPRQNGKNGIVEVRELFGMVGRGEKILHTAHEVKTARKAFKRLQYFFGRSVDDRAAKFPELNERVIELRNVNGQEAIYLDNGGSVEIVARSKNSGRGFTADVLVMDEAQEMSEEDIEALMPTTSAAPLGDPQWIFTGTPPGPKANGEVFTRTRTAALGAGVRTSWHEWSAGDPTDVIDLDSRDVWLDANPALGGRLQFAVIEGERAQFSPEGFKRERLGVWEDPATLHSVIPPECWRACEDPKASFDQVQGTPVFAVDVTPDRAKCSIAVAGRRADGLPYVEIIENRDGTHWVKDEVAKLKRAWGGKAVADQSGPAGSLFADGVDLEPVGARDHAQACALFYDLVTAEKMRHRDDDVLDIALAGAVRKDQGDGLWMWSRKSSTVDISPLVAATLALGAIGDEAPPVSFDWL